MSRDTAPAPKALPKTPSPKPAAFGQGFVLDCWYFAALGQELKPGKLQRFEILGEPVLLGRTQAGEAYALRDICPPPRRAALCGQVDPR